MGLSSSKTKTKSTSSSTPLDQYAPYITQGLTTADGILKANQGNTEKIGQNAMDVYNGLAAPQSSLANIYGGTNPAQANYTKLQGAAANDPSMGVLQHLAQGSTSPGQYDGIGGNNPSLSILQGMTNQQVNGDSAQFYKDTLSGKYLNNNPYIDGIAKQGEDAALKAVNQRFAASGMGAGFSSPYAAAATDSIANANNTLRYGAYNNELNRMGTIGSQSDGEYNATQDRSLSAANSLGNQYNASGQLQLGAQQAKDAAFASDRAAQLAAGQSLGSQYNANNQTSLAATNGDLQSQLAAMAQIPGMTAAQLQALQAAASIPYTGVGAYSGVVNGLTGKYGNVDQTGTSTTNGNLGQMVAGLGGAALSGWASGGFR